MHGHNIKSLNLYSQPFNTLKGKYACHPPPTPQCKRGFTDIWFTNKIKLAHGNSLKFFGPPKLSKTCTSNKRKGS